LIKHFNLNPVKKLLKLNIPNDKIKEISSTISSQKRQKYDETEIIYKSAKTHKHTKSKLLEFSTGRKNYISQDNNQNFLLFINNKIIIL
jgi:hypothetical protein